jgi:hypothetical protein
VYFGKYVRQIQPNSQYEEPDIINFHVKFSWEKWRMGAVSSTTMKAWRRECGWLIVQTDQIQNFTS